MIQLQTTLTDMDVPLWSKERFHTVLISKYTNLKADQLIGLVYSVGDTPVPITLLATPLCLLAHSEVISQNTLSWLSVICQTYQSCSAAGTGCETLNLPLNLFWTISLSCRMWYASSWRNLYSRPLIFPVSLTSISVSELR